MKISVYPFEKISRTRYSGVGVGTGVRVSPDSAHVVFAANPGSSTDFNVYSIPITGGTPVMLNEPLAGQSVSTSLIEISPDSSFVAYVAEQEADEVNELYRVPIDGGTPGKLSGPMTEPAPGHDGGDVSSFRMRNDSAHVVYRADQETDEKHELYRGGCPCTNEDGDDRAS